MFVNYCVVLYDVCLCDVLGDVIGVVFVIGVTCVGVLILCLLDVLMLTCVLVSGLCLCCAVVIRVGFNVFVRVGCALLCDVVWVVI